MDYNRHPLDRLLEVMMRTNPQGKVVRIGDDGKVAEEITVQEFARRMYEMEKGKDDDMKGNWQINQEYELETGEEKTGDDQQHSDAFMRMCKTTDEISSLAGRLYYGCKKYKVPFIARLLVVYAFIRGVMEG